MSFFTILFIIVLTILSIGAILSVQLRCVLSLILLQSFHKIGVSMVLIVLLGFTVVGPGTNIVLNVNHLKRLTLCSHTLYVKTFKQIWSVLKHPKRLLKENVESILNTSRILYNQLKRTVKIIKEINSILSKLTIWSTKSLIQYSISYGISVSRS